MKTLKTLAILATALIGGFSFLDAQEASPSPTPEVSPAPSPSNKKGIQPLSTASPAPASTPGASPAPTLSPSGAPAAAPGQSPGPALEEPAQLPPLPLMPQPLPPAAPAKSPSPVTPPAGKQGKAAKAGATPTPIPLTAEQLRKNIRLCELTTQVLREDRSVTKMRRTAELAKTFEGRRTALRDYYTLLYTKIEKLDPTLHDLVEQILFTHLYALEQHRVRPSKLLEPIPVLPGSHAEDHLSGSNGAVLSNTIPAPTATPAPAALPGENPSFLEMQ